MFEESGDHMIGMHECLRCENFISGERSPYTWKCRAFPDGIPYERVLKMVTETPAKALGIEDRAGKVQVGLDADLCIFSDLPGLDADAVCELVFIEGNVVYQRG